MDYRRKHTRRRPRGWLDLWIRLGGWAALALGATLVVLTLFSAGLLFVADRMDREVKFTRAVIKEKRIETPVGGTPRHLVTFTYKTSTGGQTTEAEVPAAFYADAALEAEHVIRYRRDDPEQIAVDDGGVRRAGNLVRYLGLLTGILGLILLWRFGKQTNRALLARRDGEKRFAEVTGITPANVVLNGVEQARLEWREQDGQAGESLMRDMAELSRLYQAGDKIVVFRLGQEAFWEGDVGPPRREVGP